MLWEESATLAACVAAIDAEWQAALVTYIITYTCLPDSIRPPEPKGK